MHTPERLARLGGAQGGMARAVEMKLAGAERAIGLLLAARGEIEALAAAPAQAHMAFLPVALRKLAELDARLASARAEAEAFRRQLMAARAREKAFAKRERQLRDALARKAGEEDALETALSMAAKASGKPDVLS